MSTGDPSCGSTVHIIIGVLSELNPALMTRATVVGDTPYVNAGDTVNPGIHPTSFGSASVTKTELASASETLIEQQIPVAGVLNTRVVPSLSFMVNTGSKL